MTDRLHRITLVIARTEVISRESAFLITLEVRQGLFEMTSEKSEMRTVCEGNNCDLAGSNLVQ